jgi:HEPN domain-containing protein
MSDADERRAEAARWLAIADQDMAAARLCASSSPPLPAVAGYHCQQAVEKIVKALSRREPLFRKRTISRL